ncbi:hypothetical protein EW145_g6601, partial [Phellinidium pouzarii]
TGAAVFPISTRNSAPAVAFLLAETKAKYLFVSAERALQDLAYDSDKLLGSDVEVQKMEMPVFEDVFPTKRFDPHFEMVPSAKLVMDGPSLIYHSSGTTSFPKPISLTHRSLLWKSYLSRYGEIDLTGCIFGCHSIPSFHAMGSFPLGFPAAVGVVAAVFKPRSPAIVPNAVNVIESVIATKCDYIYITPFFLEAWSENIEYINALAKLRAVVFAGGPLDKDAGDRLVRGGVNVYMTYASTQTSIISEFLSKEPPGMEWDYFKLSRACKVHYEDFGNNEFEIVVQTTDRYRPIVINTQVNGVDAYATGDLVSPHPTKRGYYKVVGRTDDQIMHSNGEKTNPGPLERMLNHHPLVEASVIFGRGRFQCGVLIQPVQSASFNSTNTTQLVEFRDAVWPIVEKMNAFAPTHSRIFKEMILVANPAKPFEYTSKGTLRRQPIINEYRQEIDALYDAVAESAQEGINGPVDWSPLSILDFMRILVKRTLKGDVHALGDDTDLFERGLDSLQATWVRNTILRVLRESHAKLTHTLPTNFVYDHPTIAGLANYIYSVVAAESAPSVPAGQDENTNASVKRSELRALVDKYASAFPTFIPGRVSTEMRWDGDVVLLTGCTGSLGSNILATLIHSPSVARIYAVSRFSADGSVRKRLVKAFERDSLDVKLLDNAKVHVLEADLSRSDFGIDKEHYAELQSSVTHIIHNAWRVNFNNAIASFEANIRSVRNFIDFALGGHHETPARILFISSIGVFRNYIGSERAPEERLEIADSAVGSGYGESKWVAEQILVKVSEETAMKTTIIRPGQLTGGGGGGWNTHEWFPSLIKSSVSLGKLPEFEGSVSWLPADVAGRAIVEMLDTDESVLHLVHPRPVAWNAIISEFSKVLELRVVPYSGWLASLEGTSSAMECSGEDDGNVKVTEALETIPALRLLWFFQAAAAGTLRISCEQREALGVARLGSEKARRVSGELRDAEMMRVEESVIRWVNYWKGSGFL